MKSFVEFFKTHFLALVLVLFSLTVSAANYAPGTWLLGWDNLVPEFNWQLNVGRALFSAWQEYQGLGLAGGMAHGASLIREGLLWLVSPLLPAALVRYFWTFAMLAIGPLGAYYLFLNFFQTKQQTLAKQAAFIAGLFYLFNLATVQYFYTPFETFSSFYGFLPWLLWAGLRLLKTGDQRAKLIYFIVSLLATSAFQVQTLFIVYGLVSGVFILEIWLRERRAAVKKILSWLGLTLVANLFWLVPVIYFTLFHSSINLNAKQNQLSTPELRVMNQNFGGLGDIAALKGYWFEYLDRSGSSGHQYLLEPWRAYTSQALVTPVLQSLFVLGLLGLVLTLGRRQQKTYRWSWLIAGLGMLAILTSGAGKLGGLYAWLETNVPLFEQIFRTTFTKWSMVMALFVAMGLGALFLVVGKRLASNFRKGFFLFLSAAILIIAPPFFQGKLIYDQMRLELPSAYLELFEFFADRPRQARVAVLPAEKIFSWDFQDWGYRGSGFVWYGIEQPILDRAFDVYSAENETFYHQLSEAWHNGNPEEMGAVLQRYDVGYVLLDESTLYASSNPTELLATARRLLERSGYSEIWQKDFLTVFEYPHIAHQDFISAPSSVELVQLADAFQARREFLISPPAFITPSSNNQQDWQRTQIVPWAGLTKQELINFAYESGQVNLTQNIYLAPGAEYQLTMPTLEPGMSYNSPAIVTIQNGSASITFPPLGQLTVGEQQVSLPTLGTYSFELSNAGGQYLFAINDQSIVVDQGDTQTIVVPIRVGQVLSLSIDAVLGTDAQGGVFVNSANQQSLTVPGTIWQPFLALAPVAIEKSGPTQIELSLPVVEHDLLANFQALDITETCDVFGRGVAHKETLSTGSLLYTAQDAGSLCASLGIRGIAPDSSYVLLARGENLAGRSLKIGFSSVERNFFYLENLADKGQFEHAYAVLPQGRTESEYFLNLETRSFGRELSQNRLDALLALQLPVAYELLSQIKLVPTDYQPINNFVEILETRKWGTSFYLLKVEVQADEGVMAFHQGYDAGWLAFKLSGWPRLLEHFKYNDWANAWILPEGQQTIVLIYLPQVGVFAALVLALGTLVWLIKPRVWRSN